MFDKMMFIDAFIYYSQEERKYIAEARNGTLAVRENLDETKNLLRELLEDLYEAYGRDEKAFLSGNASEKCLDGLERLADTKPEIINAESFEINLYEENG
jgi:hypothetical protein